MLTKELIDNFYEDVSSLKLKFPVAAIQKATGFGKGTVSQYLNKRLEPSENFIKIFYEHFSDSLKKVPRAPQEINSLMNKRFDGDGSSQGQLIEAIMTLTRNNEKVIDTNATIADTNKVLADKLVSMKTTESADQRTLEECVGLIKALREYSLEIGATVNKTKKLEQEQILNKKVMSAMGKVGRKDIRSEAGS